MKKKIFGIGMALLMAISLFTFAGCDLFSKEEEKNDCCDAQVKDGLVYGNPCCARNDDCCK
jgi:hypothetical protein